MIGCRKNLPILGVLASAAFVRLRRMRRRIKSVAFAVEASLPLISVPSPLHTKRPNVLLQRCVWILSSHKSLWGSLNGAPDFKDNLLSSGRTSFFVCKFHFSATVPSLNHHARTEVAVENLQRVIGENEALKKPFEDPSHSLRKL